MQNYWSCIVREDLVVIDGQKTKGKRLQGVREVKAYERGICYVKLHLKKVP